METNICNNCGTEMSENKKLCRDCQNKKDDRDRKIRGVILGGIGLFTVGFLKYLSGSDNDDV